MLRVVLISTVLLAQLSWTLKPLIPYLEYGLNYEYISKVLCINQEKPELACDGKCYLRAKIEQQAQQEEPLNAIVPMAPDWETFVSAEAPSVPVSAQHREPIPAFRMCEDHAHDLWQGEIPTPPPRMG